MDDALRAALTDAERAHAGGLLDVEGRDLRDAVVSLFADLSDPLLAADDVADLLGVSERREELLGILSQLSTQEGILEVSEKTQRPFDSTGIRLYRRAESEGGSLRLVALESVDRRGNRRYQFSVNGRLIRSLARIDRLDALDDTGNQRNEIKKHVEKISEGIRSGTMVPSPILLVMLDEATQVDDPDDEYSDGDAPRSFVKVHPFTEDADFIEVISSDELIQQVRLVELEFPYRKAAFDDEKSVLLVDGQQRTAALALVPIEEMPSIELAATAVIANSEAAKRVFQVANDTVKISTDFSRALLASMSEPPGYLKLEKVRADAARRLALFDESSPFKGLVKHPGARAAKSIIAYNSLFSVVSIFADGFPEDLVDTSESLSNVISRSYQAVKETWPEAWELKPTQSKLMHGVGLRSMAGLAVSKLSSLLEAGHTLDDPETWEMFKQSLFRLRQRIVWTDAAAAEATTGTRKIHREQIAGRQNTSQDIAALSDFLRKESLDLDMRASRGRR